MSSRQTGRLRDRHRLTEEGVHLEQGNQRFMLGDYQGAIANYSKAIELNPTNATAFYSRGLAYLGTGQKALAKADLTKSRDLGYHVPHEALHLCM